MWLRQIIRCVDMKRMSFGTDYPAYSDTGYNDTPVTVTVLAVPKIWIVSKTLLLRVTIYSDTFPSSQGCHCKRGSLYLNQKLFSDSYSLIIIVCTCTRQAWIEVSKPNLKTTAAPGQAGERARCENAAGVGRGVCEWEERELKFNSCCMHELGHATSQLLP